MKEKFLAFNDSALDEKAAQNWYKILSAFFILVHASVFVFATFAGIRQLVYMNIGSTLLFGLSYALIQKNFLELTFYTIQLDIMFHSISVCIMLPDDISFCLYLLILVPLSFFFLYLARAKHKIIKAGICSLLAAAVFVWCKLIPHYTTPIYSIDDISKWITVVTIFNSILTFGAIGFFCSVFITIVSKSLENSDLKIQKLDEDANRDLLTGLYNKRTMNNYLKEAAEKAEAENSSFNIMLIDVDNLKTLSETYGQSNCDKVIVGIADILKECTDEDDYLFRFAEDEYLVVIKSLDFETTIKLAEAVRRRVEERTFELNSIDINRTVTIGISEFKHGTTGKEMLDEADSLVHYGKKHGKNQVVTRLTLL